MLAFRVIRFALAAALLLSLAACGNTPLERAGTGGLAGAAAGQVIVAVALAGFGPGVAVCVQVSVAVVTAACGTQVSPMAAVVVVTVWLALLVIKKLLGAVAGMLQAT